VSSHSLTRFASASCLGLALVSAGCGELVRQGRTPAQVVINSLAAASGAEPDDMGGVLHSDVVTLVSRTINEVETLVPTIYADLGEVQMSLIMRDPGLPSAPSTPSALNQITMSRYRVTYRRTDGRNTPGIDVPFPFDGAITFTVPSSGIVTAGFEIVRHTAKQEAPLRGLAAGGTIISTLAEVTFYGRDQAGNEVSVSGNITVDFGNFGDPE
jgi:hypothetical protein